MFQSLLQTRKPPGTETEAWKYLVVLRLPTSTHSPSSSTSTESRVCQEWPAAAATLPATRLRLKLERGVVRGARLLHVSSRVCCR